MRKMMALLVLAALSTGAAYACDGDGKSKKNCCSSSATAKTKKAACGIKHAKAAPVPAKKA